MDITLFDKKIKVRDNHCALNESASLMRVAQPYVNIYVRLRNDCNARCSFCEFRGEKTGFDVYKFYYVLSQISKTTRINKVSFTGGEPTLDVEMFKTAVEMTKQIDENIFTIVNTNGINLDKIVNLGLDSIALSRHHYDDEENCNILGFQAPSAEKISKLPNKDRIHLSCNIIKGKIDSEAEVIKYLTHASEIGIHDTGFVSLMKVNDYCKEHNIDFADFDFSKHEDITLSKTWNNKDVCKCANYLFISPIGSVVKMYSRYCLRPNDTESLLVFDGSNLKNGFQGEIII